MSVTKNSQAPTSNMNLDTIYESNDHSQLNSRKRTQRKMLGKSLKKKSNRIGDDFDASYKTSKHVSMMDVTMESGMRVKDIIEAIDKCVEDRKTNPKT